MVQNLQLSRIPIDLHANICHLKCNHTRLSNPTAEYQSMILDIRASALSNKLGTGRPNAHACLSAHQPRENQPAQDKYDDVHT